MKNVFFNSIDRLTKIIIFIIILFHIIGSVKEAEEFDKLPIEESKRRLRILLGKMDLNSDNFIDRNELKAWILRSFG